MKSITIVSIFLISLSLFESTTATSYLALLNSKPKCYVINSSIRTELLITYESPEILSSPPADDSAIHSRGRPKDLPVQQDAAASIADARKQQDNQRGHSDGRDREWQRKMEGKMKQSIQEVSIRMTKTIMTIAETDTKGANTSTREEDLYGKWGSFTHRLALGDSLEVCVQSYGASNLKPIFISLEVKELFDIPKSEKTEAELKNIKTSENHVKYLERELQLLNELMDHTLSASTRSKMAHAASHTVSISMNSKFKWFSMFQICITLVTGAYFAKFLLSFLRKRNII